MTKLTAVAVSACIFAGLSVYVIDLAAAQPAPDNDSPAGHVESAKLTTSLGLQRAQDAAKKDAAGDYKTAAADWSGSAYFYGRAIYYYGLVKDKTSQDRSQTARIKGFQQSCKSSCDATLKQKGGGKPSSGSTASGSGGDAAAIKDCKTKCDTSGIKDAADDLSKQGLSLLS